VDGRGGGGRRRRGRLCSQERRYRRRRSRRPVGLSLPVVRLVTRTIHSLSSIEPRFDCKITL
jgi:hypothetical protein